MDLDRIIAEAVELSGGADRFDYLGASDGIIAGWRHGHSDLDLYAVVAQGWKLSREMVEVYGLPEQFNTIRTEKSQTIQEFYREFRISTQDQTQYFEHTRDSRVASRLASARTVVAPAGA